MRPKKHIVMKRKIYDQLLDWKRRENGHVALMIQGARRVGKSFIVEQFARQEYKSYILIDFAHLPEAIRKIFDLYLHETDKFLMYLQNALQIKLYERESLIIFDEVQRYGKAREAIKYLVADGRYDYIETGSLISIMENSEDITIPSEERDIEMYPMDFEEFLWALGDEMTMPFIRKCFENREGLGPIHRQTMDLFRQYMIVGGMPQAVAKYIETKDFQAVDIIKRDILSLYRKDISRHAKGYETKVRALFDQIPSELQKHEHRFRLSDIAKGARYRNYESSFLWLGDAKVALMCRNVTEPQVGMAMRTDNEAFKMYLLDTGLLLSQAFSEKTIQGEELYSKLLLNKLEVNAGMLIENIVAQMFTASGHRLFYYQKNDRENADNRIEIDFLIEKETLTNRHNICAVEVKSGKRFVTTSLDKFERKFAEQLSSSYVIYDGEYKHEGNRFFIPLYMAGLL